MCKIYGYCRAGIKKDSIERQIENICKAYPTVRLYKDESTGLLAGRPKWDSLIGRVKEGDTIVFESISVMHSDVDEAVKMYLKYYEMGIDLVFLNEKHLSTTTYKGALGFKTVKSGNRFDIVLQGIDSYVLSVTKELAERQIRLLYERVKIEFNDLSERTKEGLERARLNGKQIGQVKGKVYKVKKAEESKEKILKLSQDFNGTFTDKEVLDLLKINRNTYYKYKKELREELGV